MRSTRPTTTSLIRCEEIRKLVDYKYFMKMYSTVNMAEKLSVINANQYKINEMNIEDVSLFEQCRYVAMTDTQFVQWMWEAYECICDDIPAAKYYYSKNTPYLTCYGVK
jgi:hypothetical protein